MFNFQKFKMAYGRQFIIVKL